MRTGGFLFNSSLRPRPDTPVTRANARSRSADPVPGATRQQQEDQFKQRSDRRLVPVLVTVIVAVALVILWQLS